jgi:hypothetical protein
LIYIQQGIKVNFFIEKSERKSFEMVFKFKVIPFNTNELFKIITNHQTNHYQSCPFIWVAEKLF